jgi:hypothetical protein
MVLEIEVMVPYSLSKCNFFKLASYIYKDKRLRNIAIDRLLELNREGFFPGPKETEKAFFQRVEEAKKYFLSSPEKWIPPAHWDWVNHSLEEIFDFRPLFFPALYSNVSLAPWQGAAAWIEGRSICVIQLRERFKKGAYLGLYQREEILAHEAVHAARCAFEEGRNEEFFAYMTSEKKWRRVLGPLLRSPWEIWPFLVGVTGGLFGELAAIYWEGAEVIYPLCFLGSAIWLSLGFYRLIRQHRILRRAAEHMRRSSVDERQVRAILLRLTDEEIERFSKGEEIETYAKAQTCLRWALIRAAYVDEKETITGY